MYVSVWIQKFNRIAATVQIRKQKREKKTNMVEWKRMKVLRWSFHSCSHFLAFWISFDMWRACTMVFLPYKIPDPLSTSRKQQQNKIHSEDFCLTQIENDHWHRSSDGIVHFTEELLKKWNCSFPHDGCVRATVFIFTNAARPICAEKPFPSGKFDRTGEVFLVVVV